MKFHAACAPNIYIKSFGEFMKTSAGAVFCLTKPEAGGKLKMLKNYYVYGYV